jgi:hypothetical protein
MSSAVWGDAGLPGLTDCDEQLGGDGCPAVAAFAREPFAAGLGTSTMAGMQLLADAQGALDLVHTAGSEPVRRPTLAKTRLYLHLTAADLFTDPRPTTGVGKAERLGPETVARIKEWLGHSRATIVPVLDLQREDAVDEHDPPPWMRETVILRDRHCVFPWCARDARACDLDHVEPYVAMDEGGPPGQTNPLNLAPLCRRHHRAKTAGRWRYRRERDGTYTWRGPTARPSS